MGWAGQERGKARWIGCASAGVGAWEAQAERRRGQSGKGERDGDRASSDGRVRRRFGRRTRLRLEPGMFRQLRGGSRLGSVPLRLAVSVFFLFALLLAIAVAVGMQYERYRLARSIPPTSGQMPGGQPALGREAAWPDLFKVFGASLVLVAVGVLFFTAVRSYRAISQTVEQVKTLMRNILQSIPTGGLTIDSRGVATSLHSA